jgi:hypothetical protein
MRTRLNYLRTGTSFLRCEQSDEKEWTILTSRMAMNFKTLNNEERQTERQTGKQASK